jgi:dienelactone hydrolase
MAQDETDVMRVPYHIMPVPDNHWIEYSDAPNSLIHYLNDEAFKLLNSRCEKVSQLTTLTDWKERQSQIRQAIWKTVGAFPKKTPLNAKTTGKIKKDGYCVENIIYESLPDFYVTGSLFIPDGLKAPAPAILFCSGHTREAYRALSYQLPVLNLVKKGFIVLAIDPVGQGERIQYVDPLTDKSVIKPSESYNVKAEHSYPSAQVFLTGQSVARYFIWDGIRGIDYLVNRKEVDSGRIGVHGLSGGGTQAAYISALDNRVAASAPACYITSYRRLMESIGVQDGEQNFYHGISEGIDHADFIEARAPKPTLIMAQTNDFFSIQGTHETYRETKRVYEIFGEPGNVGLVEDDFTHGYTKKSREAMVAFFQKHLRISGSSAEENVNYLTEKELQITRTGQVLTSLGGESVFSLNRMEAEKLENRLSISRNNLTRHLPETINSAKILSGYIRPSLTDEPVFTGRILCESYVVEKYFMKGEGNYAIPYLLYIPDNSNGKAIIYLHPSGKSAETSEGGEIEWFINKGFTVLAPDLLGTGEVGPGIFRGANLEDISYNIWFSALLIGKSIVGIQAADVVKLARLLLKSKSVNDIYGVAKKEVCPVLLHAAAFDSAFSRIALVESFTSYRTMVMNKLYKPGFVHSFVPGALTTYDLPDLAACLAPRRLLITGMTDSNGICVDNGNINEDFDLINRAFRLKNAESQIIIASGQKVENLFDLYENWIE